MLSTRDMSPLIGSEVVIDADSLLAGAHSGEIRDLLVKRGVLVIRGLDLDDDQLRTFTASIGKVRKGALHEDDGMLKVFSIPGTHFWHIDGAYTDIPPFATVLCARVAADVGGETEFANTYAAWEDLPPAEQEYLAGLEVVHSMKSAMNNAVPEPTLEHFQSWMGHQGTRPLVWHHQTGRRSLVVGATASFVVGLHVADSHELLQRLLRHVTQPKFVYRHHWQIGDVVIWDNTGTMHRALPFDLESGRLMHRFAVEGTEPIAAVPISKAA
jgi:alpha-ketoglutarate-dependent taurine dioxygenase